MQRSDDEIIEKIQKEIEVGFDIIRDLTLEEFMADETIKRAASMVVINVGELVKNVSEETKAKYPNIEWKAIAGMRDLAAHKYHTLRMSDVYYTMTNEMKELNDHLDTILKEVKDN